MLSNYVKTALRNLKRTRLFSLITILGLSIGMTACVLILHYVSYERSYDRFHEERDRIYRMRYERTTEEGTTVRFASCCPPAGPLIHERNPEVERIARIFHYPAVVSFEDITFTEERMFFAEPEFLDILRFTFIAGDPLNGIRRPNTALISRSTARKYFGNQSPIGRTLTIDGKTDYEVTGVFEDVPSNSHVKFDILLSYRNLISLLGAELQEQWGHTGFDTYLRLAPHTNPRDFENKLTGLVESEFGDDLREYKMRIELKLQPLQDIHLSPHFMQELEAGGDRDSVRLLSIIAVCILIIAWVNYINLSTARSLTRAREVGIRKVVGASRRQLIEQFFFETLLLDSAAVLFTFVLVEVSLPRFCHITGTPQDYVIWTKWHFWIAIAVMFVVGIVLSGIYPVIAMSTFEPVKVLRGRLGNSPKAINLRKGLVVFQFVMALVLITCTLAVHRQIRFMKDQDLGFDIDQILVVKIPRVRDEPYDEKFIAFKETLRGHSSVDNVCVVTEVPGRQILWDAGAIRRAGEDLSKGKNYQVVGIDYDFADVFGLSFVCGRNFSREFPSDKDALILNETAVKWMGFDTAEEAVGTQVDYWGELFTIIGVMKDYHQRSPKETYEPHILRLMPQGRGTRGLFAMKIHPDDIQGTLRSVRDIYQNFFPGNPFDFFFMDEYYARQYRGDELVLKVFGAFSFLAIFVTSLGIFGLSSFMSIQRTKEIAIRKVIGARVSWILLLLTKDILVLMSVSFAIALPLSYLGIHHWLDAFAIKMSLTGWLFLWPLLIVLTVTMLTTASHIIKASVRSPVESLRYE